MGTEERSDLIAYNGMRYAPENELGVVFLFGKMHKNLGFPEIDVVQPQFPDCWAYQRVGGGTRRVWIEFEFRSRSFKAHLSDLKGLHPERGLVVCWENNGPEVRKYADVIELKTAIGFGRRIWIQSTDPIYHKDLDNAPLRRRNSWRWTVSGRARPGDLVLMYRSGTKTEAKRYQADIGRLQSIANIYEVTSQPKRDKVWKWQAHIRQLVSLRVPIRLEHLRQDPYVSRAGWLRAQLFGRPDVSADWWRLAQIALALNPELRRNKKFLETCNPLPSA